MSLLLPGNSITVTPALHPMLKKRKSLWSVRHHMPEVCCETYVHVFPLRQSISHLGFYIYMYILQITDESIVPKY